MEQQRGEYIAHFDNLYEWIKHNDFMSHDVCDVTATPLFIWLQNINQKYRYGKYIFFPFYYMSKRYPGTLRIALGISKREYAQSYALICTALLSFQKRTGEGKYNNEVHDMLSWLSENHSGDEDYMSWGQPYDWYSRKKIPAHTPRTTVTTQVGHAFLDAYEYFHQDRYLEYAMKAGSFMVEKMPWDKDAEGAVCFPYTSIDQYHIHNANVLAAALLLRLDAVRKNDQFREMAYQAFSFTAKHQNADGSWYYWAPPDRILGVIDHYHTGFVLESYKLASDLWKGDFPFRENLEKGLSFYEKHLFTNDLIPKMTSESLYPVDIQSCAQAIITLGICLPDSHEKIHKLQKLYSWIQDHLYNADQGYYYYRLYKNRRDTTPYLRWAESWMLRAQTFLI